MFFSWNPKSPQATVSGHIVRKLDNFSGFKYYQTSFWGQYRPILGPSKNGSEISVGPPETPYMGRNFCLGTPKMAKNTRWNFT